MSSMRGHRVRSGFSFSTLRRVRCTEDLKGVIVRKYGPKAKANSKGGGGMVRFSSCITFAI